jgi:hypothetical protein
MIAGRDGALDLPILMGSPRALDDFFHVAAHRSFEELPGQRYRSSGVDVALVVPELDLVVGSGERRGPVVFRPVNPADPGAKPGLGLEDGRLEPGVDEIPGLAVWNRDVQLRHGNSPPLDRRSARFARVVRSILPRASFSIEDEPMKTRAETARAPLTAYESEQVQQIAAWKSRPPNAFSEMWKRMILPGARLVEKLIPDRLVQAAIERSYDMAERLAGQEDIRRRAGVKDLHELRDKPLEECDRLARQVGLSAQTVAIAEGAATGAGGVLTTLVDVPLLFVLALRTILKIGHCYGYPLDHHKGQHFVLGVLLAALSGSLEIRRHRLDRLHELEELLVVEAQEELVTEELLSFLFQLEVFEEVPGVGALSGALLNLAFMHRVDVTAQRVFQEHWLRENGKVGAIAPAPSAERHRATGWAGALGRVAYSGCYGLGFGVALPVYAVATLFRPRDNAAARLGRDGATTRAEHAPALALS